MAKTYEEYYMDDDYKEYDNSYDSEDDLFVYGTEYDEENPYNCDDYLYEKQVAEIVRRGY